MWNIHKLNYKNNALTPSEMRRRREEWTVQLRKTKREELFSKRRNIELSLSSTSSQEDELQRSNMTNCNRQAVNADEMQLHPTSDEVMRMLYSENVRDQLKATNILRHLLARTENPPIDEVIQKGIVPQLVAFLKNKSCAELQLEAVWTLINITSGTSQQTKTVVEAGAVPVLIDLLSTSSGDIQEQAVWTLGNIAGDCPAYRDQLLRSGIVSSLLLFLGTSRKISMLQNALWTVANLCRGRKPSPDFAKVGRFVPMLARMLHTQSDPYALCDTCWAISYLSDGSNTKIQAVIDAGVCHRLVELMLHPKENVSIAAIRAVGNIVTGNDEQTQVILDNNALPPIGSLLCSAAETVKKELCWIISNIAAGNREQIQAIINADIYPKIVNIMQTSDLRTRKEGAWAISNAVNIGTLGQINYLVQVGCIPAMCDLLTDADSSIIDIVLDFLRTILKAGEEQKSMLLISYAIIVEECGGLDKIEYLQSHESDIIYQKAFDIIDTYFCFDDDNNIEKKTGDQLLNFNSSSASYGGGFNF